MNAVQTQPWFTSMGIYMNQQQTAEGKTKNLLLAKLQKLIKFTVLNY